MKLSFFAQFKIASSVPGHLLWNYSKAKKNNLFKEEESDWLIAEPSESGFIRPPPQILAEIKATPFAIKGLLVLLTPWDFQTFRRPWIEEESVSQCLLVKYLRLSTTSIIKQQKFEGKKKKCPPTKLPWSLGNQSEEVVLCVQLLSAQWIRNIDFVHKCISLKI